MTQITSKPDYGSKIAENDTVTPQYQNFFDDFDREVNDKLLGPAVKFPIYTVATLPAVVEGGMIYVSDETGGAVPAFGDGLDWRRVTDRAIVS